MHSLYVRANIKHLYDYVKQFFSGEGMVLPLLGVLLVLPSIIGAELTFHNYFGNLEFRCEASL